MEQENVNIQMRLISISELDFRMSLGKIDDSIAPSDIKIGFANQVDPDIENNKIAINFGVRYEIAGELVLDTIYRFLFEVKDLAKYIVAYDNEGITINYIMPHILSLAVGTMRGILVVKTAGTILSKHPLPIIDANVLTINLSRPRH